MAERMGWTGQLPSSPFLSAVCCLEDAGPHLSILKTIYTSGYMFNSLMFKGRQLFVIFFDMSTFANKTCLSCLCFDLPPSGAFFPLSLRITSVSDISILDRGISFLV